MSTKQKIIFFLVVFGFIKVSTISMFFLMGQKHEAEINRVIEATGAKVTDIDTVFGDQHPFDGRSSTNTVYKITYERDGATYIAWYRGLNNMSDIHDRPSKGYPEEWFFEE
ncbi:hypothetical protein [Brevibacillus dissolubilis]|uniref:hypothetical protein n=1 Tax=Brevibacillus dissolubilis TaxID=1844116 RepID=UPI001115B052|nr:hypothetical protein [Brevibacillus dissolubilis]